jgi:uncharacterized protein YjbI with pentapeptide repeats
VDEGFVGEVVSCGDGVCLAEGTEVCVGGEIVINCTPLPPQGDDDNCDGLDNDCNGAVDENGYQACLDGNPCTTDSCVDGGCLSEPNVSQCDDGNDCTSDVCVPLGTLGQYECVYSANPLGGECGGDNDFSYQVMNGEDFSGLDLTGAIFVGTQLEGANFKGTGLSYATFEGANLSGADFTGAVLNHTNMAGVDLSTATLTDVVTPVLMSCPLAMPPNWWCQDGYLFGDGANYNNYDFEDKSFILDGVSEMSFPLTNMKLNGASNVTLVSSESGGFHAVGFSAASSVNVTVKAINCITELNFENAQFSEADQLELNLKLFNEGQHPDVILKNADFKSSTHVTLETHGGGGNWTGAQFSGAQFDIFRAGIFSTGLSDVPPSDITYMVNVSFVDADFPTDYVFAKVEMSGVSFLDADLSLLSSEELSTAGGFAADTTFSGISGPVDFTNAKLNDVDFADMDLTNAIFSYADMTGANFTNANLSGVNFGGADLSQGVLTGANFAGVDLGAVTLDSVVVPALSACPAELPVDWICWNTHLFSNGVNYSNHDFNDMEFSAVESGMNEHIYLKGADFSNARNATFTTAPGKGLDGDNMNAVNAVNLTFTRSLGVDLPPYFKFVGADFSGSDEISIEGSGNMTIKDAIFTNADHLTLNYFDANFVNAKYVDFTGVIFTSFGGTLANTGEEGNHVELKQADFSGSTIRLGTLAPDVPGDVLGSSPHIAGLELADLEGADLTDATFLVPDGFLTNYFEDAVFQGAILTNTDFSKMHFQDADLTGADLSTATVDEASFEGANVTNVDWGICPNGQDSSETNNTCCGAPMNGAVPAAGCSLDFAGQDLVNADFSGQDLTFANFEGANLAGADFTGAVLTFSNLTTANLTGADLTGANLESADAAGTDFSGATLTNVNMDGVDLSSATLMGVKLPKFANNSCPSAVPAEWLCQDAHLWGEGVDYQDFDFANDTFTQTDQSKSFHLKDANLEGVKNLTLVASTTKGFIAPGLVLVDSAYVSLLADQATLESNFDGANFSGSDTLTIESGGAGDDPSPVPSHFKDASFDGVLNMSLETGMGGDWSQADFTNAEFLVFRTGVDWEVGTSLSPTQLTDASFDGAQLPDNYQFNGVDLTGTSFLGANLATILGGSTSWEGNAGFLDVIWEGVNLSGATLNNAVFESMDLTAVNFTGANLEGVNFTGADLTDVIWNLAICPTGSNASMNGNTCCGQLNGAFGTSGCASMPEGP